MMRRNLGFGESKYSVLHDKYFGHGSCAGVFGLEGKLDEEILRDALFIVFKRHPLLRAVLETGELPLSVSISADFLNIPFTIIHKSSEKDWINTMEFALNTPFETAKYMWRFYVLMDMESSLHEIIINTHHSISDGLSIVKMVEDILQTYSRLAAGLKVNSEKLDLLPSIETLIKGSQDLKQPKFEDKENEQADYPVMTYQGNNPVGSRKTKSIFHATDKLTTLNLLENCKENKVTVGSALGSTMLLTASEILGGTLSTKLFTPVSLRPYCNPAIEAQHIGHYITTVLTNHTVKNKTANIWTIAKDYKEKLNYNILKQVSKLTKFPADSVYSEAPNSNLSLTNKFTSGFGVVNKGKLTIADYFGPIKLRFYYATVSKQAGDKAMCVSLNSLHDKSFLRFSYTSPLITTGWAEDFVKIFMDRFYFISGCEY
jgi:Condensation domain